MIALDVPLLAPEGAADADRDAGRSVLLARSVVIDWAARYAEGGGDPARAARLLDAAERAISNLAFAQLAAARGLAAGAWEFAEIEAWARSVLEALQDDPEGPPPTPPRITAAAVSLARARH